MRAEPIGKTYAVIHQERGWPQQIVASETDGLRRAPWELISVLNRSLLRDKQDEHLPIQIAALN